MSCESQEMMCGTQNQNQSEINHKNQKEQKSKYKKKQNYKQKTLLFWGAWHESHKNFGQRVELFRTIFRWGGKDVSQIAPYMGTSDDKGSN